MSHWRDERRGEIYVDLIGIEVQMDVPHIRSSRQVRATGGRRVQRVEVKGIGAHSNGPIFNTRPPIPWAISIDLPFEVVRRGVAVRLSILTRRIMWCWFDAVSMLSESEVVEWLEANDFTGKDVDDFVGCVQVAQLLFQCMETSIPDEHQDEIDAVYEILFTHSTYTGDEGRFRDPYGDLAARLALS